MNVFIGGLLFRGVRTFRLRLNLEQRFPVGSGMKTARFSSLVERAGKPMAYLSWVTPERDPELKKLLHQDRVLTVHQTFRGAKKDFGTVGFHRGDSGQILVFPRPLRRFADKKIVGIDYTLVEQGQARSGKGLKRRPPAPMPVRAKPPEPAQAAPQKTKEDRRPAKPAPTREQLLSAIRKAVAELKAGRAVPAYERLAALVSP